MDSWEKERELEKLKEKEEERKMVRTFVGIGIAVLMVISVILSIVIVPAGSVGVVTRFGDVSRVAPAGLSMKIPWIEGVTRMSVRTQMVQVDASAASSNLQTVTSVISINFHLDPIYAQRVYADVGRNYQELVLAPAIQDSFKKVTSEFTAEQLIQRRSEVSVRAEDELQRKVEQYHIIIENFNIINFDFSPEYNASIENKQVAEQNVATAKQLLQKAQVEAQTKVVEAQAQADSQKALKDTGALTSEYLEYLFLSKWDGKLPTVMGGATSVLDVMQFADSTAK